MKKVNLFAVLILSTLILSACKIQTKPECKLYINQPTNEVNCFIENLQPSSWLPYQKPEIGIPYACFEGENGSCELAQ